ncbi:MAG TPA: enoyl-CoA hydratase/isomerase family protein [Natronosporangium sp.]|nr:enoyl-CoA hydratase/isomerase family protein [Natronosporangium sp.]
MTSPGVRLDQDGPVATITLCRPEVRNAQTPQMWQALRDIGRQLPGDVRVVVVRGEGPTFSAGLDLACLRPQPEGDGLLAELAALPEEAAEQRIAEFQQAFGWLRRPNLISIAAVQGHAVGAGFQLALACDLRVLTSDARLVMAEVSHGLVPDLGGTKRLVELVGYARALEICVTAREVTAAEAAAIGLANLVVPAAELTAAVADLVAAVLAADRSTVTEIKALLGMAAGRSYADQERAERQAQVRRIRDLAGIGE